MADDPPLEICIGQWIRLQEGVIVDDLDEFFLRGYNKIDFQRCQIKARSFFNKVLVLLDRYRHAVLQCFPK